MRRAIRSLRITPATGESQRYYLDPQSTVGAITVAGRSVVIRPKIGVGQLLSLACFAIGKVRLQDDDFDFPEETALPDAIALALCAAARRAFARGVLRGYLTRDDALQMVRGRIRFDDQIRRRFGVPLPVEVRYDEFTDDILENRLVKAAAHRLGRLPLRSVRARDGLRRVAAWLDEVSLCEYPPNAVPHVSFDRLNRRYDGVVTLSRLILRHGEYEAARGEVPASGFLMDMNQVFQEFLTVALGEALGLPAAVFGERKIRRLDDDDRVLLKPDLVWTEGTRTAFVGDAKYKNIEGGAVPNADLYQLLAYATAEDLPGGLLVYAKGEADGREYTVRHAGKRLRVMALDLSGSLSTVLERVGEIANVVRELRVEALQRRRAA